MVKVALARSSPRGHPRGHPPLKRPARLHGAALWKTPRRVGAEQRPLRCPPAVADPHRLCPCRRGRAWSVRRSSSTSRATRTCRRSPPPSPTPPSRSARTPHAALARGACRPWAVRQRAHSAPPPPLGSARARPRSPVPAPPQGAPGSCGRRGAPRQQPAHWAPNHCLGCSSQPPPKAAHFPAWDHSVSAKKTGLNPDPDPDPDPGLNPDPDPDPGPGSDPDPGPGPGPDH